MRVSAVKSLGKFAAITGLALMTWLWSFILACAILIAGLKALPFVIALESGLERPFPLALTWILWVMITPLAIATGSTWALLTRRLHQWWEALFSPTPSPDNEVAPNSVVYSYQTAGGDVPVTNMVDVSELPKKRPKPLTAPWQVFVFVSAPAILVIYALAPIMAWMSLMKREEAFAPDEYQLLIGNFNVDLFMASHGPMVTGIMFWGMAVVFLWLAIRVYFRLRRLGYYHALIMHHQWLTERWYEREACHLEALREEGATDISAE